MSLRVAVDLRLFHLLVGKTRPLSAEELAQAAGAETFLIGNDIHAIYFVHRDRFFCSQSHM